MEARICIDVIDLCAKNNIEIYTAHDCFFTASINVERVKEFYFNSFIKLILKENLLETFCKNNGLNEFIDFKSISKNQKLILKKIKKGELKQSYFVLN